MEITAFGFQYTFYKVPRLFQKYDFCIICIQTCNGASNDLMRKVCEDKDPGDSNCNKHHHIEDVGSS